MGILVIYLFIRHRSAGLQELLARAQHGEVCLYVLLCAAVRMPEQTHATTSILAHYILLSNIVDQSPHCVAAFTASPVRYFQKLYKSYERATKPSFAGSISEQ